MKNIILALHLMFETLNYWREHVMKAESLDDLKRQEFQVLLNTSAGKIIPEIKYRT